jgi:transketolase
MIFQNNEVKLENTRTAFGQALLDLARDGYDVVGIAADTSKSMCLDLLQDEFPKRVYEVGIAEQNMMMVAAGLASTGKIVFVTSYSVFLSMKCLEQLRTFIAYPRLNVKVVAGLGGFTAGIEGVTHMSLEDLGIIRCIPNICLINLADAQSTKKAIRAIADYDGPAYLRIGRDPSPVVFTDAYKFTIGKANFLKDNGNDLAILATGFPVYQAIQALDILKQERIGAKLVEIHTIKPIDKDAILNLAKDTGALLVVQEHYRTGGLGSAVAEILVKNYPVPMEEIAVDDIFTESALPDELRRHYGLTVENICKAARKVISRKLK